MSCPQMLWFYSTSPKVLHEVINNPIYYIYE